MKVTVTRAIADVCPGFKGALVEADVVNTEHNAELWNEIDSAAETYRKTYTTESIKQLKPIDATRRVYRACGKDPSRYRPAAESLLRRVLQGKPLYHVDTLVDLLNYASMATGYSLGGFDTAKFSGTELTLGVGQKDEPYEGIGRGRLNIEGLPVYRDAQGGVGTPTSDSERTKISINTKRLTVLINGYDGDEEALIHCAELIKRLATTYANATNVVIREFIYE